MSTSGTRTPGDTEPRLGLGRNDFAVAAALWVVVTVVALTQLFAGDDVGLHDNGDGWRLWCHAGRDVPVLDDFSFVSERGSAAACAYDPDRNGWAFPSSMDPALRVALRVDALVSGSTESFDLRTLGVLGSIALGAVAAAAVFVFPGPLWLRGALVGGTMLLWLDIGFLAYLNSYYSEAAGLVGGAGLVVALAAYLRRPEWWTGAILFVAALVAGMAKPQALTILLPLFVTVIAGSWLARRDRWTSAIAVGVIALIMIAAAVYASMIGPFYAEVNTYNAVFTAVLGESDDPVAELEALGLPPGLAGFAGHGYWPEETSAVGHPDYPQFTADANRARVVVYVLTHPRLAIPIAETTLKSVREFRPGYLGNHAGRPGIATRPEPTTWLLRALRPAWLWLPLVWLTAMIGGSAVAWRRRHDETARVWGLTAAFIGAAAAVAAVAVPLADGYFEIGKHLVFAAWWTAPLLVGGLIAAAFAAVRILASLRSVAG